MTVITILFAFLLSLPLTSNDSPDIIVNFVGDCVFWGHFEYWMETQYNGDLSGIFDGIPWFPQSDINMINLEHPVTTRRDALDKEFVFKMSPKFLPIFKFGNINIVNGANNHVYDYGPEGVEDTIEYLDSVNVAYAGIGHTINDAREPVVFHVKNRRVGFLGYYGAGLFAATDTSASVAPRYRAYVVEDVKNIRDEVDYVVVSFHWGVENEHYPEEWQMELGRATIDAGADLVVGHHSHVLQGIERYRHGVIAYSLGNFIFGGHHRRIHDTLVLQVSFGDEMTVRPIPVRIKNWEPLELTDGEAVSV